MKKILTAIVASIALAGVSYAGCGKKVTNEGTLSEYDKDTKSIVVTDEDGKASKLTLTADTKIKGKDGKAAEIDDVVEKDVKVVSEHKKVDSVTVSS